MNGKHFAKDAIDVTTFKVSEWANINIMTDLSASGTVSKYVIGSERAVNNTVSTTSGWSPVLCRPVYDLMAM